MTAKISAKNFKRKTLALAAAMLLAVLLFAIKASAADGAYSTGASLPDYNSGSEVSALDYKADPTGEKDSASAIQKALNVGRDEASDTAQVIVRVPAGTYLISKPLKIYSNTRLILEDGATILKGFSQGCMLKNTMQYGGSGYDADRNIVIEGGTWDGNTSQYNDVYSFSNIRIAHASNVVFRNVTVLNNKNGHHLEIGGVRGLTVEGCYFSGYTGSLLKEAIQLDVMNSEELFSGFAPFDDTPCDNVIIRSCTFRDLPRGIGSHSAVVGEYYTNVTIRDNTFDDISNICMVLYNYRRCTISGNTITGSGAGITFNYMSDESFRHYFQPLIGNSAAAANIIDDADTVIENNSISTVQTTLQFSPFGIKLFGKSVSANKDYPAYNYTVKNVRLSGNTINSAGAGIVMQNVYDSSVKDNAVNAGDIESDLVSASYCYGISFKNNTVSNSLKSGLRISNVSDFTVSGNEFSGNAVCAAVVGSAEDCTVSKNTIKDSGSGGIKISDSSSGVTCSGNVIKTFGEYGIQISGAGSGTDIKVKSNDISGGSVGISCAKDGKAYLSGNSFEAVTDKVYAAADGLVTLAKAKNFTAEEITSDRIKLTWNAISEADGISVYRRSAGMAEFDLIAEVESGSIFQDERLISGTNYFYKIVPYITIGEENAGNTESSEIQARTKINIGTAYVDCVGEAAFTAKPVTPDFKVVADSRELTAGTDYEYRYDNNIYTGTAVISITGKGDYIGSLSYSFEITLTGERVSNSSRNAVAGAPFAKLSDCRFSVNCSAADGMLLADSDEKVTLGERSVNSLTVRVPVTTSVRGTLWSEAGYERLGSRLG